MQFIETAPAEIKKIRVEMEKAAQLHAREEIDVPEGATLREIEQLLLKAKANFTTVEAKVATLTRQLATQTERPLKASQRLADVDAYVAGLIAGSPPEEAGKIDMELRGLLASRRELLDKIIASNQTSLGLMAELDVVYRQLLNTVTSYDTFLAERLLWMRSTPPLRLKDSYDLPREVAILFSPGPWLATVRLLAPRRAPHRSSSWFAW